MKARIAARIAAARERQQPTPIAGPKPTETHYTPDEIAEMWKLHPSTVRKVFQDVHGVLKVGDSVRVPHSVLERFHAERQR
jgi:hypothetical protein